MTNKQVAEDIYDRLHDLYYGNDPKSRQFRFNFGSNGVVNSVLDYIYNTYLDKDDDANE